MTFCRVTQIDFVWHEITQEEIGVFSAYKAK